MDLFYKLLWRHLLVVEILKLRYDIKNEQDGRNFLDGIFTWFHRDKARKKSFEYFNEWGDRGGGSPDAAFDAWFQMIQTRYKKHVNKLKISDHPKYIKEKLLDLDKNQFGFDAFGLKLTTKRDAFDYLISYKNRIIDNYL